jgi:hypothetical protein
MNDRISDRIIKKNKTRKIIFFTSTIAKSSCSATGCVKNTRPKVTAMKVEDMNRVKKDALNVKYSSNGRVCGVLVVDVC